MIGVSGRSRLAVAFGVALLAFVVGAEASIPKPRVVMILPFDADGLPREDRWLGHGIAQVLGLTFAEHPGFVQVDPARVRALGAPDVWGDASVVQAARSAKADVALFGRASRTEAAVVIHPRVLDVKAAAGDSVSLEPVSLPADELLERLGTLPVAYMKALRVAVSEAQRARMEKAARPTRSLRAFELYTRGQIALARGGPDANESSVDLLSRAIEADPSFAVAQYALGTVHQALGNRWKAAAQFRAAAQLDPTAPEPLKALGDLFMAAPRRLYDQAVEAYTKAIELRPFYADAHVGLGEARAAKGDVDGAVAAFEKALVHNPVNPRVHLALGKIYHTEKELYYEAVDAYKRAIDLDPDSVPARMGLGEVYEEKGLYKEALEEYRRVIELDGKHTGALYNLALVYEKIDPREAMVQWERYIELASQLPSEKDWVDLARQRLRKLQGQVKD
jgi:tetratricopeptide (TPR) repeat protein